MTSKFSARLLVGAAFIALAAATNISAASSSDPVQSAESAAPAAIAHQFRSLCDQADGAE